MTACARFAAIVALWLACAGLTARAQDTAVADTPDEVYLGPNEPARTSKAGKVLHARYIITDTPRIDGRLDDLVWTLAPKASGFVQWDPDNGEPASERTEIQVAYDTQYLYVSVYCYDRNPDLIARGLSRRDDTFSTDYISIGFDPRHDHLTGYIFQVNPSGVQSDSYAYDDDKSDRDFDFVWEARTAIVSDGWTAEIRIPFSQMRFDSSNLPGQIWGFGVRRNLRRRSELSQWTARPRGEKGEVSRWGHLIFDEGFAPGRRFEVQPYVLGSSQRDPTLSGSQFSSSTGVDLRLGIGSAATLSATINPDFGQVEQDPAVLNLSVFETYYPEKRTFFLEDSRTFVPPYSQFQLFYSRRIGRKPNLFAIPGDDLEIRRPSRTTVAGAAKLTGKASGWTFGALTALTQRESATVTSAPAATPVLETREVLIEPRTSYNAVRVQRDVRDGSSNVGAIFTGVVRENQPSAFTGGFDHNLRWDRNRVVWNGNWAATRAPGGATVATSGGGVSNFNFSRKHYGFSSHFDHFGRDFRVNDIGFLRARANRSEAQGSVWFEQPDPWMAWRKITATLYAERSWNNDRLVFSNYVGGVVSTQFRNFWSLDVEGGRNLQVFDDLDTRGGPPILVPARPYLYVLINTDSRKSWRVSLNANAQRSTVGSWNAQLAPTVTLQPSTRLQASLGSSYTVGYDVAQWIANEEVTADGVKDYVYGSLKRHVVDLTMRTTYAIQRDLTLQVFFQPFVAVGDYTNIRRLAKPMSFEFEPATLSYDPDFNNKSLRGNVVLRWEYLRGSTLFVVWNTSAADAARAGVFSPMRDLRDAFRASGPNVLMVKVSYWLGR